MESGEDLRIAAVRELAEETGLVADAALLEGPVSLRRHVGRWADRTIDTRETFFAVRDVVHEVDGRGRAALELAADEPHRWWDPAEIAADGVTFAPRELPAAFPALLSGPWTGPPRIVR